MREVAGEEPYAVHRIKLVDGVYVALFFGEQMVNAGVEVEEFHQ
jgi:hypothetical protein